MDYLTNRWTNLVHVLLFYTTYISVALAHHEIFRVKVGKGGINNKYIDRVCFCGLKYSPRNLFGVREIPPLSLKVFISSEDECLM